MERGISNAILLNFIQYKLQYFLLCRRFVETKVPELRMLNQNTFFSVAEISNEFETESAIHVNYHDRNILQLYCY